jgi:hypothetical protein
MIKALTDPDQLVSTLMLYVIQNFHSGAWDQLSRPYVTRAPGKLATERA